MRVNSPCFKACRVIVTPETWVITDTETLDVSLNQPMAEMLLCIQRLFMCHGSWISTFPTMQIKHARKFFSAGYVKHTWQKIQATELCVFLSDTLKNWKKGVLHWGFRSVASKFQIKKPNIKTIWFRNKTFFKEKKWVSYWPLHPLDFIAVKETFFLLFSGKLLKELHLF